MACYIISYDLRNQRDYEKLYEGIRAYSSWAQILESAWAVVTSKFATEIRDHLKGHIDSDDGLFVIKSGGEAAWTKVNCKNEWPKEHL
jgi:hypothetical protein